MLEKQLLSNYRTNIDSKSGVNNFE